MKRWISSLFLILVQNLTQIQFFQHQASYEWHQLILPYPIHRARREHQCLLRIPLAKRLRHAPHSTAIPTLYGSITWTGSSKEGSTRRSNKCHATLASARRGRSESLPG